MIIVNNIIKDGLVAKANSKTIIEVDILGETN